MNRSTSSSVAIAASVALLAGCGTAASSPLHTTTAIRTPSPPSVGPSPQEKPTAFAGPPGSEGAFVRRYLDAVVAGRCQVARSMMASPSVPDSAGRPYRDARSGNGLCGRTKAGQLTIDGWVWGDQRTGAMGTMVFTVPVVLHVTSAPSQWSAYQLPLYSALNGRLYVTGAPTR